MRQDLGQLMKYGPSASAKTMTDATGVMSLPRFGGQPLLRRCPELTSPKRGKVSAR